MRNSYGNSSLKILKTIVELKGFNRSAARLGYITSHIKAIENELGVPVFERMGNKNILTEIGKSFLQYAIEMINLYSLSIEEVKYSGIPKGTLVIGTTESLAIHKLLPFINEYIEKYPLVDVKLKSGDSDKLRSLLHYGEVDMALLSDYEEKEYDNLYISKVSNDHMVFVTSNNDKITQKTILFTQIGCGFQAVFNKKQHPCVWIHLLI
ncbi:LysR family transcriptional regulator [Virgibacillus oceani]